MVELLLGLGYLATGGIAYAVGRAGRRKEARKIVQASLVIAMQAAKEEAYADVLKVLGDAQGAPVET